jgi:hypothetical protein
LPQFDHEKLDVYKVALEFVILIDKIVEQFPKGRAYLVDQLQRAGTSILLNNLSFGFFCPLGCVKASGIDDRDLTNIDKYGSDPDRRSARAFTLAQRAKKPKTQVNIAEGAGEYARSEKGRFYRMAKRSGTECAGIFDICLRLKLIEEEQYKKGREMLVRIVCMLTKMVQGLT